MTNTKLWVNKSTTFPGGPYNIGVCSLGGADNKFPQLQNIKDPAKYIFDKALAFSFFIILLSQI